MSLGTEQISIITQAVLRSRLSTPKYLSALVSSSGIYSPSLPLLTPALGTWPKEDALAVGVGPVVAAEEPDAGAEGVPEVGAEEGFGEEAEGLDEDVVGAEGDDEELEEDEVVVVPVAAAGTEEEVLADDP